MWKIEEEIRILSQGGGDVGRDMNRGTERTILASIQYMAICSIDCT